MNVYKNEYGELTCSTLDSQTTVTHIIDAVLRFCQELDCTVCAQSCCAGLTVFADHVFLARLLHLSCQSMNGQDLADLPTRVMAFDNAAARWHLPQNSDGRCKFLSRSNRCMIYEARPLVCRLHVCCKIEPGFRQLKAAIYFTYQDALCRKMSQQLQLDGCYSSGKRDANPVLAIDTYDVPLAAILSWV